jgi:DNA-nicking Smr family endonuclease
MRTLSADELNLWARVAEDITPLRARSVAIAPDPAPQSAILKRVSVHPVPQRSSAPVPVTDVAPIESRRQRRIARRDLVEATLDLHGLTEDRAYDALRAFVQASALRGHRVVLIITGKGRAGAGVLRRRFPDWLERAELRPYIGGYAHAGQGHGGDGAFYLAIKRL